MKNRLFIYALAAVSVLSLCNLESQAANLSLGSSGGIATALEAYEASAMNADKRIMEYLDNVQTNKDLCIAKVDNYVNVRKGPSENEEVVGKLYDKSAGHVLEEVDGWYKISSGSIEEGYVKKEYVVVGKEAEELAKEVGTRLATVTTETLRVRDEASTESAILGLVPQGEELVVKEEVEGWVKVSIEEGEGWVSIDYVSLRTDMFRLSPRRKNRHDLPEKKRQEEQPMKQQPRRQTHLHLRWLEILPVPLQDVQLQIMPASS